MIDWQRSYCGSAPGPMDWAGRWNGDPVVIALLLLGCVAMLRLGASRRRAGWAAIGVLAVAFVSPLCALTTALFAARSVHHLLVFAVAAPLLALAVPARSPSVAIALPLSSVVLWAWHVPVLYDAALGHVGLYWVLQIALIVGGWYYWSALAQAGPVEAMAGIAGGAVQMGFLGALLTFAGRPLYASHLATTVPFGIGPLADQQLAGLVMWVPGMLPYALAAGWWAARRWRGLSQAAVAA